MICERCHGKGWRIVSEDDAVRQVEPCANCGGTGSQSCCDGATGLDGEIVNEGTPARVKRRK